MKKTPPTRRKTAVKPKGRKRTVRSRQADRSQITAVVPAYNEQKNIRMVLEVLKTVDDFSEIIVVDDGSQDLTSDIARGVGGVTVLTLPHNMGKTRAVQEAVSQIKTEHFMMIDADLFGLEKRHIKEVVDTYRQGFDMVILDYGNQELYLRRIFKSFPALSGVRIMSKTDFESVPFSNSDRLELENRINTYFLDTKRSIIVVTGDTVRTPHKYEKYSFYKGLYLEAKGQREIFLGMGARNIGKVIQSWWKIHAMRKPIDAAHLE